MAGFRLLFILTRIVGREEKKAGSAAPGQAPSLYRDSLHLIIGISIDYSLSDRLFHHPYAGDRAGHERNEAHRMKEGSAAANVTSAAEIEKERIYSRES